MAALHGVVLRKLNGMEEGSDTGGVGEWGGEGVQVSAEGSPGFGMDGASGGAIASGGGGAVSGGGGGAVRGGEGGAIGGSGGGDGAVELFGGHRDLGQPDAGGVADGVADGGGSRDDRRLADAS